MRTFKDFVLEDTTTSSVSGAGDNPDKTVAVRPKTHTHPRNELQARVNRLKPYGVVTHIEEDTEEEQKKRVGPTGGKDNPFNPERQKKIKQMIKPLEEDDRYYRDKSGKLKLKPEYANQETPGWKRLDYGLKAKPYTGPDRSTWQKASDVLGPEQKKAGEERIKELARKKEQKRRAEEIKDQRQKEQLKKMQKFNEELKVGDKGHLGFAVKGGTGFEGTIQDINKDGMIAVKSKYDPKRTVVGHKDKFTKG